MLKESSVDLILGFLQDARYREGLLAAAVAVAAMQHIDDTLDENPCEGLGSIMEMISERHCVTMRDHHFTELCLRELSSRLQEVITSELRLMTLSLSRRWNASSIMLFDEDRSKTFSSAAQLWHSRPRCLELTYCPFLILSRQIKIKRRLVVHLLASSGLRFHLLPNN